MAKSRTPGASPSAPAAQAPSTALGQDLPTKDYLVEAGNAGLKVFGGYIVEEFDPNLRGRKGAQTYREMSDTDPTIGAIMYVFRQVISKIGWHWQPADQTPMSLLAQQYFESLEDDMEHPWGEFISDVLTMFIYGYAPIEIVLKQRKGPSSNKAKSSKFEDGMFGLRKLALRHQETLLRWIFDSDNNDVLGMVQMPWTGGIRMIPRDKMLLFRCSPRGNNPEGRSLIRNAYRPYYFKKRIEEIEGIGIERDLAGFPVMKVPGELIAMAQAGDPVATATLAAYQNMVKSIKRNSQEGALLPSDSDEHGHLLYELTLLSATGRRQFDTNVTIERYTQQIATSVMADFLLMGHSSRGGGQALGSSKIDMFFGAITGFVKGIIDVINSELVPLISDINGIPQENRPAIYTDKPEQIDLGRLGAYINALAASGMTLFPDQDLENYLRTAAGLPEASEETIAQQDQIKQSGGDMGPGAGGEALPGPKPASGGPGAQMNGTDGAQGQFGQSAGAGGNGASPPGGAQDPHLLQQNGFGNEQDQGY